MNTVFETWYNNHSDIDLIVGDCEGLILENVTDSSITTVIYGKGRVGYCPYFIDKIPL